MLALFAQTLLLAAPALAQTTRQTITVTATAYDCLCTPSATTLATGAARPATTAPAAAPIAVVAAGAPQPGTISSATRPTTTQAAVSTARPNTPVVGAVVNAVATTRPTTTGTSSSTPAACPATAHKDYNGSPNWPRLITTVNSNTPTVSRGTDYFAYVGGGNSTLLTYEFDGSATCTLQYQFPTKAQILALRGTTDYTFSGDGAVTLYKLVSVAGATQSFNSKPARSSTSYDFVVQPGTNTTIATFPCGAAGTAVTYELAARGNTVWSAFYDWNPPPHGLIMLTC